MNVVNGNFCEFTMTDGKTLYVDSRQVAGIFENHFGDRTETVINMASGSHYTVKESAKNVLSDVIEMRR